MRLSLVVLLAAAAFGLSTTSATAQVVPGPRPNLEPQEVVQAMLLALKKNSDQGLAELYRFSSPRNREQVGPLDKFALIIREGFPDMLGHRAARLGPPLLDGDRAMMPVEVDGSDAQTHRYVFLLSRQTVPECNGCWMADAVFSPEQLEGGEGGKPPEYPT